MIDTHRQPPEAPTPQAVTIRFVCPKCGQMTEFSSAVAGKDAPCVRCSELVAVPSEEDLLSVAGRKARFWTPLSVGVLIAVVVAMIVVVLGLVSAAHETSARTQCRERYGRVAVALLAYHNRHGFFPSPTWNDRAGRPLQSWRVAVLPFMEEEALYGKFELNEPWDTQHNVKTRMRMPVEWSCPLDDELTQRRRTRNQLITGPQTIFPHSGPLSLNMIEARDGAAFTLLVVESKRSVAWNEPLDLDVRRMSYRVNDPDKEHCIGSRHKGSASAAFADGHTRDLLDGYSQTFIKALIGVDDKVPIEWGQ